MTEKKEKIKRPKRSSLKKTRSYATPRDYHKAASLFYKEQASYLEHKRKEAADKGTVHWVMALRAGAANKKWPKKKQKSPTQGKTAKKYREMRKQ